MIDERKEKAITLIINGDPIVDIAKLVGVARATIYNWLDDEEFKAELDRRRQDIVTQGNNLILSELGLYIKELKKIALCGRSEKVRTDTAQYLIDRVLGKTTTKLEANLIENDLNKLNNDILEQEFSEVDDG